MIKKLLVLMIAVIAVSIFIPKGFAIELPLRIVCNGEKVVFRIRSLHRQSGQNNGTVKVLGEELGPRYHGTAQKRGHV